MGITERRARALTAIEAAFKAGGMSSPSGTSAEPSQTDTLRSDAEREKDAPLRAAADRNAPGRLHVVTGVPSG